MTDVQRSGRSNATLYYLDRNLEAGRGSLPALFHGEQMLTYEEFHRQVWSAASLFAAEGIRWGDRVVLILPDSPLFAACIFAVMGIGAIPVPVSTRLSTVDYRAIIADCSPAALIVAGERAPTVRDLRFPLPGIRVWSTDRDGPLRQGIAAASPRPSLHTRRRDIAILQYTSGSTGEPKGVIHDHQALVEVSTGLAERLGWRAADRGFSVAKLSFGYGFGNSLLTPFSVGASTVLLSRPANPLNTLEVIGKFKPTILSGVPRLYSALLRLPHLEEDCDLSCLRLCLSAGEKLSAELFARWKDRFGLEIVDCFGATECVHVFLAGEPGDLRPGSAGKPIAGFRLKLVADDLSRRDRGTSMGELWVRGVCDRSRYWNRDDATLKLKVGPWTRTGDIFTRDENDGFVFVARSDDVIKVGGFKVSPLEVEDVLGCHRAVGACAAVERRGRDGLSELVVYVCPSEGWSADRKLKRELREFLRPRLATHKRPRAIEFVTELPKTRTGKISRHKLRAEAAGGSG